MRNILVASCRYVNFKTIGKEQVRPCRICRGSGPCNREIPMLDPVRKVCPRPQLPSQYRGFDASRVCPTAPSTKKTSSSSLSATSPARLRMLNTAAGGAVSDKPADTSGSACDPQGIREVRWNHSCGSFKCSSRSLREITPTIRPSSRTGTILCRPSTVIRSTLSIGSSGVTNTAPGFM